MINENNEPLVSIISPCYNGAKYLSNFLDSILNQTYNNIEVYIINDGSTDNTLDILNAYRDKFKNRGFVYNIISQDNNGQASAINQALPLIKGKYLTWPDSDDILIETSIEEKVKYLETNDKPGLVITYTGAYKEKNLRNPIAVFKRQFNEKYENLFDDLIFEHNAPIACGGYMVKTDCFFDALPSKHIYESRGGQNWQMLLPIAYKYTCGHIDKILYKYIVHSDSHSHSVVKYKDILERTYVHEKILLTTLKSMDIKEYPDYERKIKIKYCRKRLQLASSKQNKELAMLSFKGLEDLNALEKQDNVLYKRANSKIFNFIYRAFVSLPKFIFNKLFRR